MDLMDDFSVGDREPNSQQEDGSLSQEATETQENVSPFRERNISSTPTNVSREDSSFGSQISVNSPGVFKKVPSLNKAVIKQYNSSFCKICNTTLNTKEIPRLITHIKKCKAIDSQLRTEIVSEYEGMNNRVNNNTILDEKWAKFMVENNVPLKCVESLSFIDFMTHATNGWKWADRKKYSYHYIPSMSRAVRDRMFAQVQNNENYITVEFDHWKDIMSRSLLGIVFTFPNGRRYLKDLIDVSLESHSAEHTVPHLAQALETLPISTINSIVSDSDSACRLSRELMVNKTNFNRLIQHRCIAHLLNRMGAKFGESEHIVNAFTWASQTTSSIKRSVKLLKILHNAGQRRPIAPCKVRWYSQIDSIESLLGAKDIMFSALNSDPELMKKNRDWMNDDDNWIAIERAGKILRPLANCIGVSERKTGSLGEAIRSLLWYARDLFFGDWSEPLIVVAISSFLSYFGPEKLGDEEFALLLAAYVLDRRNKCDFITEDGLDLVFQAISKVALKDSCSISVLNTLKEDYSKFCTQKGQFACNQPENQSAVIWWSQISTCSSLKQVALRIVRLTSSSANIERTFSTLKWYQGCRRTNLSIETLTHLTRIRIYEDESHDESSLGANEEQVPSHDQQDDNDQENASSLTVSHDDEYENWTERRSKDNYVPEMLEQDMILPLYEHFIKYVDFTLINKLNLDPNESQPELSPEQMQELTRECRLMRQRNRISSDEEIRQVNSITGGDQE